MAMPREKENISIEFFYLDLHHYHKRGNQLDEDQLIG